MKILSKDGYIIQVNEYKKFSLLNEIHEIHEECKEQKECDDEPVQLPMFDKDIITKSMDSIESGIKNYSNDEIIDISLCLNYLGFDSKIISSFIEPIIKRHIKFLFNHRKINLICIDTRMYFSYKKNGQGHWKKMQSIDTEENKQYWKKIAPLFDCIVCDAVRNFIKFIYFDEFETEKFQGKLIFHNQFNGGILINGYFVRHELSYYVNMNYHISYRGQTDLKIFQNCAKYYGISSHISRHKNKIYILIQHED